MAFASTRERWRQAQEPVEPKRKPAAAAPEKPKRKPRKKAESK